MKTNIAKIKYEKEFGCKKGGTYFRAAMLILKHTERTKKQAAHGKAA